jgi:quercetin dioxygenase-like cupin family protein
MKFIEYRGQRANLAGILPAVAILSLAILALSSQAHAQGAALPPVVCKPLSERTSPLGCWILSDDSVGRLTKPQIFWHLDVYPSRNAAVAAKGLRGTVVESLGKVWLLTIADATWHPRKGKHVATIGPLPVKPGEKYSAQYMEAIFIPGMTSSVHNHAGPEAWYTEAGETCLETSDGNVMKGRAGGPPVIVPEGLSMHLTATGKAQRRALVLILHDSSKPPSTMVHDWSPKGLCTR